MNTKRKKPTKAEQKIKKAARSAAVITPQVRSGKPPVSSLSNPAFDKIVAKAEGKKRVLHIGCADYKPEKLHATYRGDDWFEIRLDIDANAKPDIVADMLDMSAVPTASVDAVWSSHNIEHLHSHQVPMAFKEIFRVLRPHGHFLVTMPDIQTVANYVAQGDLLEPIYDSPAGPISPIDIMYGLRGAIARGNYFMAHKTAFTAKSLGLALRDAGFTNIRVERKWVDLWAIGVKLPVGHPQRVENIEFKTDDKTAAMAMPTPMPVNRTPHPGQFAANIRADELNIAPNNFTPPQLNQS